MFNKYILNLIIFTTYLAAQQVEIDNIRPIAHVDLGACNDVWGYTAPDGHEFALVGHRTGTYIFDVSTNPHDPIEVGFILGETSSWRDLKVHGYYCYVTNETGGGVDIISLEDPFNPYKVGSHTSSTPTAHNLFIADGYAYLVGSGGGGGGTPSWQGIIILELSDPENPTEVGRWEETYIHDIFVKNDTAYACDIYNGSLFIIDVSDKTNPTTMVEHNYSNYGCHAVWVTDDSKYAVTGDEESGGYVYIFDIQDFNNINMVATWYPDEPQVQNKSVHNVLIKDDLLYISYYVYGTRIVDISDPYDPIEVGYYDWYPGQQGLYSGNWGVYPFTENGLIYSTDYSGNGFFIMSYPYMGEIEFEKLPDTENNVDPITLSATINESSDYSVNYSTLMLYWGLNGTITDSITLTMSGNSYIGSITPTGQNGTLHYYVAFNTMTGQRVTKPYGSPYASFTFNIGTDNVLPEIELITDLADQFYPSGSYEVVSIASDNIGISMVELFWQASNGAIQSVICTESYDQEVGVIYEGILSYENISPGTEISYWTVATDASSQSNQSESELKHFIISDSYVLGDFENEEELDRWELGDWGRQYVNHDIKWVINDSPSGLYSPNAYNPCYLIEPLDLTHFNQAYIKFNSGEILYPGDYGYFQIKRGNTTGWSTILTIHTYNDQEILERFVNLNSFINESELYIRLLMTSNSTDESQGWFVDDIFLVLNQDMPPNVNTDSGIINLPDQVQLYANYPNPFNPITNIAFSLSKYYMVDLKIMDIKGRQIRQLLNNDFAAGRHNVSWNGTNDLGAAVGSGIYFIILRTEGKVLSQKLSLIR
jgi:choice-of-anchor B domain-containing protein